MHGGGAGDDGGLLHDLIPVGIILGDAVGLCQGQEVHFIGFHLVQQLLLQLVALGLQGDDLLLDIGILLLADGQGTNHVAQGGADGANQGSCAAAAGGGSIGGQNSDKFTAGC